MTNYLQYTGSKRTRPIEGTSRNIKPKIYDPVDEIINLIDNLTVDGTIDDNNPLLDDLSELVNNLDINISTKITQDDISDISEKMSKVSMTNDTQKKLIEFSKKISYIITLCGKQPCTTEFNQSNKYNRNDRNDPPPIC
jgi:hypothetical protein